MRAMHPSMPSTICDRCESCSALSIAFASATATTWKIFLLLHPSILSLPPPYAALAPYYISDHHGHCVC